MVSYYRRRSWKTLSALLFAAAALLAPGQARAQTDSLPPTHDSFIRSGTPDATGNISLAIVGTDISGSSIAQGLFQFDLSGIPGGVTITSADLVLTVIGGENVGTAFDIDVHRITAAWDETTVTWNSFGGAYDASVEASLSVGNVGTYSWSITSLAQSWYTGSVNNYGVLVKEDVSQAGLSKWIGTKENADPLVRPQLVVTYAGAVPADYYWQRDSGTSVAGFTTDSPACGDSERDVFITTTMSAGGFNCTDFRHEGRAAVPQNLMLMINDAAYVVATDVTGIDTRLFFGDNAASGGVTVRYELGYAQGGLFTSWGSVDEGPNEPEQLYVTDLSSISGTAPAGSHLALRITDVAPSPGDMRMEFGSDDDSGVLNVTETVAAPAAVCPGAPGGGPVRFEGCAEAKAQSVTSIAVPVPAGTSSGDLLVAAIAIDSNKFVSLAPPPAQGWTLVNVGATWNGGEVTLGVYYKIADPAEPAAHTFTWSDADDTYAWMMRFTGHDPVSPIPEHGAMNIVATTTPATPGLNTNVDSMLVVRMGAFDHDDVTIDSPGLAGNTPITMDESGTGAATTVSGGAGYAVQAIAGPTPTPTFTLTAAEEARTATISIAPFLGYSISGTVFEDVNYGGGAGRDLATSSGAGRSGALVELYDASGNFVDSVSTNGSGQYTFAGLGAADYQVRVVNSTVTSSRTGYVPTLISVQTFRTDASSGTAVAVTNKIGGELPSEIDAVANNGSQTLADLNAAAGHEVESIAPVTLSGSDVTNVDFGFNFSTIVNTENSFQGSLRQFITNANALSNTGLAQVGLPAGEETTIFEIPTTDPGYSAAPLSFTIQPATELTTVSDPANIDGTTQAEYTSTPVIVLDGNSVAAASAGLRVDAGNSLVRGLVIGRFTDDGIVLFTNGSNIVQGNYIGLDVTGSIDWGNAILGLEMRIGSSSNQIGGTGPGQGNVISANGSHGIYIQNSGTTLNTVEGNYIGTNAAGTGGLGNQGDGIRIANGASSNVIGGVGSARNVISDNGVLTNADMDGIRVMDAGTDANIIRGNYVGTDNTGLIPLGNSDDGISVMPGATNTTIEGNVVADAGASALASTHDGIYVEGVATTGTIIQGNYIGTDIGGTVDLGGTHSGIRFFDQVSGTTIGGSGGGEGNVIANWTFNGILVQPSILTANPIRGNVIRDNGSLGIDLQGGTEDGNGVTSNDVDDVDTGPNNLQNFPILTSAQSGGGSTTIQGTLNSYPSSTFYVDFYSNTTGGPSGHGEAVVYLGADTVSTDINGDVSFSTVLPVSVAVGDSVTATATISSLSTSEFSANVEVIAAATITQTGFAWSDDVASFTSKGDDVPLAFQVNTVYVLGVQVAMTATVASDTWVLQVREDGAGPWLNVYQLGGGESPVWQTDAVHTFALANGAVVPIAGFGNGTAPGGFSAVDGEFSDDNNGLSDGYTGSNIYTELQYTIRAEPAAAGHSYEFRVDYQGAPLNGGYSTLAVATPPAPDPRISSLADQTFWVGKAPTPISQIQVGDAAAASITAANDIRIRIPAGFNMSWDTLDVAATITGTVAKVSTTVSYEDAGKTLVVDVTSDFAPGDRIRITDLSFLDFTAISGIDNLELEIDNAGTVADEDSSTIEIVAAGTPTISSDFDQSFRVGSPPIAMALITLVEDSVKPSVTAGNDIRIRVPIGFNMIWDTSDTNATILGTAAGKVSSTVSFEDGGKTLVIDVLTDFAAGDVITIQDLSFSTFTAISFPADNLELEVLNDGGVTSLDDKEIFIVFVASTPHIASAEDQTFAVGDPPTSMIILRVTDDPVPVIKAATDIRISIPAALPMIWDTTDVDPVFSGRARSNVASTVSYEDGGKTLVIDVLTDFSPDDWLNVKALGFMSFASASAARNLQLDVNDDGTSDAFDERDKIILGPSFDMFVAPDTVWRSGLPSNGSNYQVDFTVSNIGSIADGADLLTTTAPGGTISVISITGTDITQGADPDSARLASVPPGSSRVATVTYSVADVAEGTIDTLIFVARSTGNPAESDDGRLIFTVDRPNLTIAKGVAPGGTPPPGTDLTYTITVTNTGSEAAVAVASVDSLAPEVRFKVGSVVTNFPAGIGVTVEYSDDDGATWTYSPVSGGCGAPVGYDDCVTGIRWSLQDDLGAVAPDNTGDVQFIARIK